MTSLIYRDVQQKVPSVTLGPQSRDRWNSIVFFFQTDQINLRTATTTCSLEQGYSFSVNHLTEKILEYDWLRGAQFPVNSVQIWN